MKNYWLEKRNPIQNWSKSSYFINYNGQICLATDLVVCVKRKEYEDPADTKDEWEKIMQFITKEMPIKPAHQRIKTHWEFKFIDGQEIYIIRTVDRALFDFFDSFYPKI